MAAMMEFRQPHWNYKDVYFEIFSIENVGLCHYLFFQILKKKKKFITIGSILWACQIKILYMCMWMNRIFWYFGLYFMVFNWTIGKIQRQRHKIIITIIIKMWRIWYQNKGNLITFTKTHNFACLGGLRYALMLPREGPLSVLPQGSNGS